MYSVDIIISYIVNYCISNYIHTNNAYTILIKLITRVINNIGTI